MSLTFAVDEEYMGVREIDDFLQQNRINILKSIKLL